jgi:hypothetical protein
MGLAIRGDGGRREGGAEIENRPAIAGALKLLLSLMPLVFVLFEVAGLQA